MINVKISLATLLLVVLMVPGNAWAVMIDNGDFSIGIQNWSAGGNIEANNEEAILGDNNQIYSFLYQGVRHAPGLYAIEFDFLNTLSDTVPSDPFVFPDSFFASIYFVNEISQFDLGNAQYENAITLFDLDYSGAFNLNGTISSSLKGPEWSHFATTFTNKYDYIIPAFEIFDFNFENNDSRIFLDNVRIQENLNVIPEPSTFFLLGGGLFVLLTESVRRKLKSKNTHILKPNSV
jgi:hypothetical protein